MAGLAQYSDLYEHVHAELPECPLPLFLARAKTAGRQLFGERALWHEWLPPVPIVDYQRGYTLAHAYDAFVHRVREVRLNGATQHARGYELHDGNALRFVDGCAPHDLDAQLLVCGTAGSTDLPTWQAVGDGSLTFVLDSSSYSVSGLNFAGQSFEGIAAAIETGIRAAVESTLVRVLWFDSRFRIWVEGGTIGELLAGASGTDLAGASWMNGLSGAATAAARLEVDAVLRPELDADDIPDWLMDRFGEVIIAGAMWRLLRQRRKPWSDPERAEEYRAEWRRGLAAARMDDGNRHQDGAASVGVA